MSEPRFPMHTLAQARRSLQQLWWENYHGFIDADRFHVVRAKLKARIGEFERDSNAARDR